MFYKSEIDVIDYKTSDNQAEKVFVIDFVCVLGLQVCVTPLIAG